MATAESQGRRPIGIGIVGTGLMGSIHAARYAKNKGYRLIGYYNRTAAKAEELVRRPGGQVYESFDALLADGRSAIEIVLAAYHRQGAASRRRNFVKRPKRYRSDAACHPLLRQGTS